MAHVMAASLTTVRSLPSRSGPRRPHRDEHTSAPRYLVVSIGERRLSICWSKYEREQWERERREREQQRDAERLRRLAFTAPELDEPDLELLEPKKPDRELIRS